MYSIKRSLQLKVLTIFLLMGALLLTGTYFTLRLFVLPAFQHLELTQSQSQLAGVEQAIDGQLQSLRALDLEYAWWDGSYAFIQDPGSHPDFIRNNGLDPSYWSQIDIDMMLFFDLDGKLVWGNIIDATDGHPLSLAENLQPWAGPDHPLVVPRNGQGGTMGFLRLPAGLMLVAAFPILRNDQSGPPAGSVVVGRFVTPEQIAGLGNATLESVTLYPLSGTVLPTPVQRTASTLLAAPASVMTEQTNSHTYVRELIRDVTEKPVAVLEVVAPRKVSLLGFSTGVRALQFLAAATLLFIFTGWLLFRRWMLSPVLTLQQQISEMHEQRKLAQVRIDSEDEIGALAQHFNHLVKELGQAWRDLEKSRDEALRLATAKGEFLAAMSHEIRTPMNGVLGMTELLGATELDARQRDFVRGIKNSGELLLSVINDILDFSRMESGKLELETTSFDLLALLENTIDLLAVQAHSKGLELLLLLPPEVEHEFVGDPNRLRQILINLISNAIKFTHEGQVLLKVSVTQKAPNTMDVLFEVSDTGIGIDRAHREKIFEAFAQADTSLARRYGGTGLGLSICRQLVALMGGKINLKSEPGKGSVFWFRLRLPTSGKIIPAPQLPPGAEGIRVLVVDGNEACRDILNRRLGTWNISPDLAASGEEALELLQAASEQKRAYTVLLLDWQMNPTQGAELVKRINASTSISRPHIIVMGSAVSNDDSFKADQLGIDIYLSKPVHRAKLHASLQQLLSGLKRKKTAPEPASPPAAETPPLQAKVLLVEDNVVNQDVARFMLEACGCEVTVCDNGADAVLSLRKEGFDLVLMDCSMPGMDGFEATRRIRDNEAENGQHTPIIALTANVLEGVREHCLKAGMDDYLPKPFSKSELLAIMREWLPQE